MTETEFIKKHDKYAKFIANLYCKKYNTCYEFDDYYQTILLYILIAFRKDNSINNRYVRVIMRQACIDLGRSIEKLFASSTYRRYRKTGEKDKAFLKYEQCLTKNTCQYDDTLHYDFLDVNKKIDEKRIIYIMLSSLQEQYGTKRKCSQKNMNRFIRRDFEIVKMYLRWYNFTEIAEEFGITKSRANQIIIGLTRIASDKIKQIEYRG